MSASPCHAILPLVCGMQPLQRSPRISPSYTGELCKDVQALLELGFQQLPLDERDELEDLAQADAERFEDEVRAWQAASAQRRRAGEKRKRGA